MTAETTNQEAAITEVVDTFDYGNAAEGVNNESAETTESTDATNEVTEKAENEIAQEDLTATELEEIEYEGAQHKVPKQLKDAIMRHADYTRKTQEVAEQRKALEAKAQAIEQQAEIANASIEERAALIAVNHRLQQFQQVDWNDLNATDPLTAQKLWFERTQLVEAQGALQTKLSQKEQEKTREKEQKASEAQQSTAKQIRECFDVVAREIKGWSPEMGKALTKTGIDLGFSDEELSKVHDPRFVKLLHKAHIAEQLLKKQVSPPPKPAPKPLPQVGGSSAPVKKAPSDMTMDEYAKWRRSQRK